MTTRSAETDEIVPKPSRTDTTTALWATQYGAWYPNHKRYTPKSIVIDLESVEPRFVEWLDEDGVVLANANDSRHARTLPQNDEAEVMSEPSDDEDEGAFFPALNAEIERALQAYGAVFPKLNWSAPQDAAWIMPGHTLRCQTPNDVYLLIKSSDFAMKDVVQLRELAQACEADSRYQRPRLQLVLKKWFDMPRSHEFRCFVRDAHVVAACQREISFYEHLQNTATQERIQSMLMDFYNENMAQTTPPDIVFDVYLTKNLDSCFLIDLNPWLDRTDTLLWTGEELEQADAQPTRIPLRVLTSPAQASQALPTYSAHMVPADVIELSQGEHIAEFAQKWSSQLQEAARP